MNVCTDMKKRKVDKKGLNILEKDFRFNGYKSAGE